MHTQAIFAFLGTIALGLILLRSILKQIFLKKLNWSLAKNGFLFLTKIHTFLGIVAVLSIAIHCYFLPSRMKNGVLYAVLGLMILQGFAGFLVKSKSLKTKQISYKIHTKYILSILIILLALIGHS